MAAKDKAIDGKIELGDKVRDRISGLTGIVYGTHDWMNQCRTITVKPQTFKDGKPEEGSAFDEAQLELIQKRAIAPAFSTTLRSRVEKVFTGGPERKVASPDRQTGRQTGR